MAAITITNVIRISPYEHMVYFTTTDFTLVDLFYEISEDDGITWGQPVELSTFTSPQTIVTSTLTNFKIRLSSNFRIHTNTFNNAYN